MYQENPPPYSANPPPPGMAPPPGPQGMPQPPPPGVKPGFSAPEPYPPPHSQHETTHGN